ncbi:MAG: hypothetical protein WC365_10285 [Candidatus Babeliales bacterium]|jgi:hypothetical protein
MLRSQIIAALLLAGALGGSVDCSTVGPVLIQNGDVQLIVNYDCFNCMSFENGTLTLYVTHNHNTAAVVKALAALAVTGGGLYGAVKLPVAPPAYDETPGFANTIPHNAKLLGIAFATGVLSAYLAYSAYHDATAPQKRIPYMLLDAHGLTRCDGMHLAWRDFEYSERDGADEQRPIFVKGSNLTLESFYDMGMQVPIPFKQFRMIAVQYLAAAK